MTIFTIRWNKKIGKNCKGRIIVRHKKSGYSNHYIPVDRNYFNKVCSNNFYFILKNIKINNVFRNSKLILSVCIKGPIQGESRYILKPYKKTYGDFIKYYNRSIKTEGDVDLLDNFSVGNKIYNIYINTMQSYKLCTSALSYAIIISKYENFIILKLPSGKTIRISNSDLASYAFSDKIEEPKYKTAGYKIKLGRRPKVRGTAMNACDHPHGGGEGKAPIGRKTIYSFTGRKCKGVKTVKITK
ncbi:Ribosomal Proteins L2 C-terminal domain family protein (apicoplast) [Babesia bovis T2Bo]|uniref:Rpl2 n=1 Tax=Babesia bovis TaxID=5865 RepID=A7AXH0_BABBO|nr:Ribosomal Proteins L2 C-terminal domain family protein [Babesia bovis T2Bo]EDO05093.1 Ribosomal Proteins L2 C-terminal domain family protein [Babesia bovis T2Bo]|eukprot:YP_002290873.1 rpl2 (apicoplast) [Babesia bovis T2Bo]